MFFKNFKDYFKREELLGIGELTKIKKIERKIITRNIITVLLTTIILILIRNYFSYRFIFEDVASWSTFYTVFGVLYAVITGFLIIESLSKYNKLQDIIQEEINTLQDMRDLVYFLNPDENIKNRILIELKEYAQSVAKNEIKDNNDYSSFSAIKNSDTTKEMYDIFSQINNMRINGEKDKIFINILMQKMLDITTLRTKRIAASVQKLPSSLKLLLKFMSWALIIGIVLLGVHNETIHIVMIVSLVFSIELLKSIILDIDNPFRGLWKVQPTPFIEYEKNIFKELNKVNLDTK